MEIKKGRTVFQLDKLQVFLFIYLFFNKHA